MSLETAIFMKTEGYQALKPPKSFPVAFECQNCYSRNYEHFCLFCYDRGKPQNPNINVVDTMTIYMIKWKD